MKYDTLNIAGRIRQERVNRDLSQRDLSQLSGVPQAQISRIESGLVDLRFSSLVALAHALGLEVTLVPRQAMPAVRSVLKVMQKGDDETTESRPAYTLDEDDDF